MVEHYDCIIIGAGPAGLLLGKELSKKFDVLVLERNKIGESNKSWVTYENRWEKEKFPKSHITGKYKNWHFPLMFNNKVDELIIKDNFIAVDEHKFLKFLGREIKSRGGVIKENYIFKNYKKINSQIVIDSKFQTKLLIDCSGNNSNIVKKYKLLDFKTNLNIYGCVAEAKNYTKESFYKIYQHPGGDHYEIFGVTKISKNETFICYFRYSDKEIDAVAYKKRFNHYMKKLNLTNFDIKEWKIGTYATGILKNRTLDNVFIFGDSGLYAPGFIGMGFNEILRQYKRVARHLSANIVNKKFSKKQLNLPEDVANDVSNIFLLLFSLVFNDLSPDMMLLMYDKVIKTFSDRDINRIMRNDLSDREAIKLVDRMLIALPLDKLIKSLSKKKLVYILELLIKLNKDIFTEEIHNLVFKHHKIKIKDLYF